MTNGAFDKNFIRVGKISSFNYPKGTARITFEDMDQSTTVEMPFMSWHYWMPKVGEQVLVVHLSNGTCAAVILGPVWHDDHRPVEGFEGLYRREYSHDDGMAYERYDDNIPLYTEFITGTAEIEATKEWSVTVGGCKITVKVDGTIKIEAPKSITIEAGELVTIKGGKVEINPDE